MADDVLADELAGAAPEDAMAEDASAGDVGASAAAAGGAGAASSSGGAPVASGGGGRGGRRKGRGGKPDDDETADRYGGKSGVFESLEAEETGPGPQKSVEGWIVIVTGIHEEAQEDDVLDKFGDYGSVRGINMNLDRRTGFVKGYAMIEFATRKEAEAAIKGMNGSKIMGRVVKVDWAFVKADGRR